MTGRSSLVRELRRLAAAGTADPEQPAEVCELCGTEIPADHRHLIHLEERRIACACELCRALLSEGPWRPTGTRTVWLGELPRGDELWARFQIPIGLAFLFEDSAAGRVVGVYPSPAGPTDCELDLEAWEELVAANPILETLEADVEGLIVNRMAEPPQHAIAPIDECYRLVGLIKANWQGISGGPLVREAVASFFSGLETAAR